MRRPCMHHPRPGGPVIYDTNFLGALQGRQRGITAQEARAWSATHDTFGLYVPRIVEMAFLAGFPTDAAAAPLSPTT
jgi:hypothetical protein